MRKRNRHSGAKKRDTLATLVERPSAATKPGDLVRATGIPSGTWIWCLQCERCYQAGEYRQVGEWQMCPYAECEGDTVLDSVLWEQRRLYYPEYPVVPERNKTYPRA